MIQPILPGAAIGVLGSGQLGRMFAIAARRMGYRVHTFSPDQDTPTGQIADVEVVAPYDDLDAVENFARSRELWSHLNSRMFPPLPPKPPIAARPSVRTEPFFTPPSSASARSDFS